MQGIFINGRRCKTKKALKEEIAKHGPHRVVLEATSAFGDEFDGQLGEAPNGTYSVVGPDPYTKRSWYATIVVATGSRVRVS